MTKYFCDRCGKEIDKDSPFKHVYSDLSCHVAGSYYVEAISLAQSHPEPTIFCKECRETIDSMVDNYIKNGKQS